jgi:hypothetical protein
VNLCLAQRASLLAALALGLAACSASGDHSTPPTDSPTALQVQPAAAQLAPGAAVRFAAIVGGAPSQAVVWSVADASGGTITADGLYTAPAAPGVFAVVATSATDASASAQATVTVAAPASDPTVASVSAFGAVGDGVTDDTAAFRAAAATGKVLLVTKPSAHYKITGTISVTNSVKGDGSLPEIRMYGTTGKESTAMLSVLNYNGTGLTISGLHLNGGWNQAPASNEWSHNIMVKGSRNITIEDNVLESPEGDNILLGGESNPNPSRNVLIQNNQLLTPWRCAVAMIWVDGVTITGNTIVKPSNYVSAIDAEPNPNGYETDWNVTITNNHFDTTAVAVMLYDMASNAPPGGIGGNFTITGNRGTAGGAGFFVQVNGGSSWVNVSRTDNF